MLGSRACPTLRREMRFKPKWPESPAILGGRVRGRTRRRPGSLWIRCGCYSICAGPVTHFRACGQKRGQNRPTRCNPPGAGIQTQVGVLITSSIRRSPDSGPRGTLPRPGARPQGTTRPRGMSTGSPVRRFRALPVRRGPLKRTPNRRRTTRSPRASAALADSNSASTAFCAAGDQLTR